MMKRNYKILVIEDDLDWINMLRVILEEEGCRVTVCSDLEEAISALSRELFHFATVDLKLLNDVQKPHNLNQPDILGGWQVLRFIKQKSLNHAMGAMLLTYYDNDEYRLKAEELGTTSYMSKRQFDKESFVRTLKLYLEEYHDVYFYEGMTGKSLLSPRKSAYNETERFEAAFRSVEGVRNYFHDKESAGIKTIVIIKLKLESDFLRINL